MKHPHLSHHAVRLQQSFWTASCASLVAGVLLGIGMGISGNFAMSPVHGHINLIGWVSLALYALAYKSHSLHEFRRMATAHALVSILAALLFPLGLWLELSGSTGALIAVAAPLWLLGAVLFCALLARRLYKTGGYVG